jgi:integron integrase
MEHTAFLNEVRDIIHENHFSHSTEKSYLGWINRFIIFNNKQHPKDMGAREVTVYLDYLTQKRHVSPSTRNQALNSLVFLYTKVLHLPLDDFHSRHVKIRKKLPTILTREEVQEILNDLQGEFRLMASLMYGSGLKLNECLSLRMRDIRIGQEEIMIRNEKDGIDRKTILPSLLIPGLSRQIQKISIQFEENKLIHGFAGTTLPDSSGQNDPERALEWDWQYLFPSGKPTTANGTTKLYQHHIHENYLQKAVKEAVRHTGITKHVSCYTFRHSFATHLLEDGYCIETVQRLLGHKDVRNTMVYKQVLNNNKFTVRSPLDL